MPTDFSTVLNDPEFQTLPLARGAKVLQALGADDNMLRLYIATKEGIDRATAGAEARRSFAESKAIPTPLDFGTAPYRAGKLPETAAEAKASEDAGKAGFASATGTVASGLIPFLPQAAQAAALPVLGGLHGAKLGRSVSTDVGLPPWLGTVIGGAAGAYSPHVIAELLGRAPLMALFKKILEGTAEKTLAAGEGAGLGGTALPTVAAEAAPAAASTAVPAVAPVAAKAAAPVVGEASGTAATAAGTATVPRAAEFGPATTSGYAPAPVRSISQQLATMLRQDATRATQAEATSLAHSGIAERIKAIAGDDPEVAKLLLKIVARGGR